MNKLIKGLSLFLLPIAIMTVAGCGNPQSLDFQYKAPKDSVLKYDLKTNGSESGNVTDLTAKKTQKMDNKSSTTLSVTEKTKEFLENGDRIVEYTLGNMNMSMTRDGKTQDFPIPQVDGQKISLKVSKYGKILEKEGTEVDEKDPASEMFLPVFPKETKKVGDTWNDTNENKLPAIPGYTVVMKSDTLNKFVGYEKVDNVNCAKIEQTITISQTTVKDPAASKDAAGVDMQITMTGKGTGVVLYDYNRGVLVKSEQDLTSDMHQKRSDTKNKLAAETKVTSKTHRSITLVPNVPESAGPTTKVTTETTKTETVKPAGSTPEKTAGAEPEKTENK